MAKGKNFSRRHETSQEHDLRQQLWRLNRSPEARRQRAKERQASSDERSIEDRLALLDQRLGEGVGAKKERKRLDTA